jgi:predicted nucleotide-binding protein (sugar kinase/HSP70/actin superfamily)
MMKGRVSCPKLAALSDVAQANLRGRAEVLSFNIDENKEPLDKTLMNLGISLGIDRKRSKIAAQSALQTMYAQRKSVEKGYIRGDRPRILLLSHPYIVYDEYLSMPIFRKLDEMGIDVYSPPPSYSAKLPDLSAWDTCSMMHQTLLGLNQHDALGVIQLSSFNCGCDSIMVEFFREILRDKKIPYMVLVMDEHSAQGGLETRLEAFVDSMGW